jgi:hypothetical protein
MKRFISVATTILLAVTVVPDSFGQLQKKTREIDKTQQDPVALGEPLSYWLKVIHDQIAKSLSWRSTQCLPKAVRRILCSLTLSRWTYWSGCAERELWLNSALARLPRYNG